MVVDFRDRPHGGSRIAGYAALIDGDGWRKALDKIDVGLLELAQKLPGIGRQRFNVAALAFGEQSVESKARFAGAGDAGNHD